MAEALVFGIDLGTTNSVIAVWKNGAPEIIPNDFAQNTTPSCVAFTQHGIAVGKMAFDLQNVNQTNTIFEAKRIIGKNYENVGKEKFHWPFTVSKDDVGRAKYSVHFEGQIKQFFPEEISAIVLKHLKEYAEKHIQQEVKYR